MSTDLMELLDSPPATLAVAEDAFERNTVERAAIVHAVHAGELWRQGGYASLEDWLERRFGLDLDHIHDLAQTRLLLPKYRQRTIFETLPGRTQATLPLPAPADSLPPDVSALIAAASAGANRENALADLAAESSARLERELAETEAREAEEERQTQFNRSLSRVRSAIRSGVKLGGDYDDLLAKARPFVAELCRLHGVDPREAFGDGEEEEGEG